MHPLWIDNKYLSMLSYRLDRFKRVDGNLCVSRCPICGDSHKDKYKTRFYVYEVEGKLRTKCHNCGYSKGFSYFLKDFDANIYSDYLFDLTKEKMENSGKRRYNAKSIGETLTSVEKPHFDPLKSLKSLTTFEKNHPLIQYVARRKIPESSYDKLYFSTRFMEWVNTVIPDKFTPSQLRRDEPRLVIPFFDEDGRVFAATGRSFKSESIKYLTIKFDETKDKIYGLDSVDSLKRVYIVEGPIDSMFLDNCIAFAGSSGGVPRFDDSVIILDNEPRNKDIIRLNEKFIDAGYNICIWPKSIAVKDINDLVVSGCSKEEIKKIIDDNTYSGLEAKLELAKWRVVK